MKQRIIDAVHRKMVLRLRATFQQVRADPIQQGLFNFRCHDNCVEFIRLRPDADYLIAEVMMVEDGVPTLHYVVRRASEPGVYGEITLGWRSKQIEYYLIRELPTVYNETIHAEFNRSLDYWLKEYVPAWMRWLFNIDRVC